MSDQHDTPAQLEEMRRALPACLEDMVRSYLMYWGPVPVPAEHAEALRDYLRSQSRTRTKPRRIGKLMLPDSIDDLLQVVSSVTMYLPVAPEQVHAAMTWIQQAATERARYELIEALHSLPGEGGPILNLVPTGGQS
jgi:hypothetical protein